MQRYLIIKYGPPASGKGSALRQLNSILTNEKFKSSNTNTNNISINNKIEKNKNYKTTTMKIFNKTIKKENNNYNAISQKLNTLPTNVTKSLYNAYNVARKKTENIDKQIETAFKGKKKIISYESSFTSPLNQTIHWLEHLYKNHNSKNFNKVFKIIVIYPMVSLEENWMRYKKRAIYQTTTKNNKFFRFFSNFENFKSSYIKMITNLIEIITNQKKNNVSNTFQTKYIKENFIYNKTQPTFDFRFIMVDNNEKNTKKINNTNYIKVLTTCLNNATTYKLNENIKV